MRNSSLILVILIVQAVCTLFFVSDIVASVFGLRSTPIAWQWREIIEIGAALGLILGVVLGAIALRRSIAQRRAAEGKLDRAATAFGDMLAGRFDEWRLTPAERDVALFLIKGMSISEIAGLRAASEGTVKAQSGAIYRKAGVGGASQLLSLLIDDLMTDETRAVIVQAVAS